MRGLVKKIVLIVLATFLLPNSVSADSVKVGLIGGRSTIYTIRMWAPLFDFLTRKVGVPFEMAIREDYDALIEAMANQEIDLFEGGAFSHTRAFEREIGYPIVGEARGPQKIKTYRSVFIVRKDDTAQTLADLKGKSLALTDELSTSGFLLPRVMIARANIADPDHFFRQIIITGSHDRSIEAVLEGAVDAAAAADFLVEGIPPGKRDKLRIIAESDPIPLGPITVRRDFDAALAMKIQKALLDYGKEVSPEIRRIVEIEDFFVQSEDDFDSIRAYYKIAETLPKLSYTIPYQRLPTVFSDQISLEKHRAMKWMVISFALFVIVLALSAFWVRRRLSPSVGLIISAVVTVVFMFFTGIQMLLLFSSMDIFAAKKLGELQSLNMRAITIISGASSEGLNQVLANTIKDGVVVSARIFRNGRTIASSDPNEVGESLVDKVRTNTYGVPGKHVVPVLDPVILGSRKYATLQVDVSFLPVTKSVNNFIMLNSLVFVAALLMGMISSWVVRRRLARPLGDLSRAVSGLREGAGVNITATEAEVKQIAANIAKLGEELEEKERLVELKLSENIHPAKELNPEVTRRLLERVQCMENGNEEFRHLRRTQIIGLSPAWLRTLRDAAIRARDKDPVVIIGPTGSGKTGIARAIHVLSPRADQPFGEFNCAEFASADPMIVLGKLFGYGTDSGIATIDRKGQRGILEEYDGGTLFFDEVALLPVQAQQMLLLPFEGRPFNPASGKGTPRAVNVRFIFATNEGLEDLVHAGKMRIDLLRRIKARGVVKIDPLAERREDIEILADHFLAVRNLAADKVLAFDLNTVHALTRYSFDKYNVSELKGVVDQAFDNALFEGCNRIEPKHLNQDIFAVEDFVADGSVASTSVASTDAKDSFDNEERGSISALRLYQFNMTRAERHLGLAQGSKTLTNRFRGMSYRVLERNGWDVGSAAREMAGPLADKATLDRIGRKIGDYIEMARRHLEAGMTDKLFNNLPQKYTPAVEKLLDAIRANKVCSCPDIRPAQSRKQGGPSPV